MNGKLSKKGGEDMELATGKLQIIYDDKLEGLPFDIDKVSEDTGLATEELQKALTNYVSVIIKTMPQGRFVDIDINLCGNAGDMVKCRINIVHKFFLLDETGHIYIL